jgi:hypothetical protein
MKILSINAGRLSLLVNIPVDSMTASMPRSRHGNLETAAGS